MDKCDQELNVEANDTRAMEVIPVRSIRDACAAVWDQLNPSEPGVGFLATFFAAAMTLFLIGFLIGQF